MSTTVVPTASSPLDSIALVWAPRILAVVRIIAGLMFMEHGLQKLIGFPAPPPSGMLPAMLTLSWFSAVIELVGGGLLAIGLFARFAAFIISGEMAVAYFMAHAPRGFFPILNGGELAIMYCFVFLYFAAAGAGLWSIDNARKGA